ncbi:hypothetical protein SERLA73DRAFT_174740, partial [Serpula lacrymans var. lacrymans S7.3]
MKFRESYVERFSVEKYNGKPGPSVEYAPAAGSDMDDSLVDDGEGWMLRLRTGFISGRYTTFLSKTWNLPFHSHEFYTELYLYSHPQLLQPLQGVCVPSFICVYKSDEGVKDIAMEAPHSIGWHKAHPCMSKKSKQAVVDSFERIHAQGV